ncbi:helix-turn-helix domain-containing protein [Microlunatus capsulatus]|uniref:Transcriptional regulator n=1 Tax=Microlunatus capsulatus TaxID=99117 RepID=A0ABS4Z8X9_9ACTN|nr:hypothetical protein [Microlunatus capsulatus]MBP2417506.1 hypothetical protein [Microlunatus capsulatus]
MTTSQVGEGPPDHAPALVQHRPGTALVTVVTHWTAGKATVLQAATRMSQEAFAGYLGVSPRTVAKWRERPEADLRPTTSELLDTVLSRLDDLTRERFTLLLAAEPVTVSGGLVESPNGTGPAPARPTPDAVVQASQARWLDVRQYLTESGIGLASRTAALYDPVLRIDQLPALSAAAWLPERPVPLEAITLRWEAEPPAPRITGEQAEARQTLPLRAPGRAFERYTTAIRYLKSPALFENRHSYRLLNVDWRGGGGELTFGLSTFFDKLDSAEPFAHEAATAELAGQLDWTQLPYRSLVTDPFDLADRPVNPGISTLTIRWDREAGKGTFFLLQRNPSQVTNGRHYSLLPAGEFQPASISTESVATDLDLWRNMVREYSEEMLGQPEHDGSSGRPIDYDTWRFYRDMSAARTSGELRVYALGIVLDALSLNSSIATVAVVESRAFDRLFRDLVDTNAEGTLIKSLPSNRTVSGLPFDPHTVHQLTSSEPLGQTSAACLALAWQHRAVLLMDSRAA